MLQCNTSFLSNSAVMGAAVFALDQAHISVQGSTVSQGNTVGEEGVEIYLRVQAHMDAPPKLLSKLPVPQGFTFVFGHCCTSAVQCMLAGTCC